MFLYIGTLIYAEYKSSFVPFLAKLQTTPLKFGGVYILYSEILEFEFYPLKFYYVCINNPSNLLRMFSLSKKWCHVIFIA